MVHCVTFFTKPGCSLCRSAMFVITKVRQRHSFNLETVDISAPGNEHWFELYGNHIPVTHLNGCEAFRHRVDEAEFATLLTQTTISKPL